MLERHLAMTLTTAVQQELDYLRRDQVHGIVQVDPLSEVSYQHRLQERMDIIVSDRPMTKTSQNRL